MDVDIKGYFDNISHEKLMKLVEMRVSDRKMLKLIRGWLKAGVMKDDQFHESDIGSPQGGVISPLLANIYLNTHDLLPEEVQEVVAETIPLLRDPEGSQTAVRNHVAKYVLRKVKNVGKPYAGKPLVRFDEEGLVPQPFTLHCSGPDGATGGTHTARRPSSGAEPLPVQPRAGRDGTNNCEGVTLVSEAYKQAGVDIAAGNEAVERMKKHVARTFRPEVLTGLGGFGALFGLNLQKYEEPVLVSGTDGVGTKLMLAFAMDKHDTIGIDAVAMCVNDIVVQGAEPLFFLDYLACGKVVPERIEAIVKGIADGCEQSGCALIGGETAEMPGMYGEDEYDIAGFAVGIVDRKRIIDGASIKPGDAVIGLASSGVHSNGFSLVRKVLLKDSGLSLHDMLPELGGARLGDVLLEPTRLYVKPVLKLIERVEVKGLAHITGGGFIENIPRVLPEGVNVEIGYGSWPVLPIFKLLQERGKISNRDMFTTFNMGIGMVAVVPADQADEAVRTLAEQGVEAYRIGTVTPGSRIVTFTGADV
ncbi:Phosphoribosylformylglycinamidine cyclo-ligase, purM [Thermobacillus xylanilyticus]|uniref:Phosphoribosylformylglycinamidine cyclo-ligase n=1 Tax=Thermobacillus xylanilyticus TaxID=76633 RepID=A0ABN7RSC6_THEXY|nr:Phosphoribosylformylglycinamidine cyclo-ligase, purM [Thermobacillus xylanilyticus]